MGTTKYASPLPAYAAPDAQRSRNMAAIKSKGTKPEMYVRRRLHQAGFRFRLHRKDIPGSPDIVLPRYRTAVFVHGCFWHGHGCKPYTPHTNTRYWSAKIERNVNRDIRNRTALEESGWQAATIWECRLEDDTEALIQSLQAAAPVS